MSVSISPLMNGVQVFDNDGKPASGALLFTYDGGSFSIEKPTYSSSTGATPNSNPVVMDSSGRITTDLWLLNGEYYNFVVTLADTTTVLFAVDGVIGVAASTTTGGPSNLIWNAAPAAPTYLSPSIFLLDGDQTTNFTVGNRARLTIDAGFIYGTVTAVSFSNPTTQVTLELDGTAIDGSLSAAEWSIAITSGRIVDAGAVDYSSTLPYGTSGTVGNKLRLLETADATTNTYIDRTQTVQVTTGTSTAYILTPAPASVLSTNQTWVVKFHIANGLAPTLNISGTGAKSLFQYSSSGSKVAPVITTGMVSEVIYDGTDFVLLNALPAPAASATPRGGQVFTSNGSWTVPVGVSFAKVTCVGGGGGGSAGYATFGPDPHPHDGVSGGCGAMSFTYLAVTAGNTYTVTIGAGGLGGPTPSIPAQDGGQTSFGITAAYAGGGGHGVGQVDGGGTPGANSSVGTGFVLIGTPYTTGYGGPGSGGHTTTSSYGVGGQGQAGLCIVEY